jgi:hypothetical protein
LGAFVREIFVSGLNPKDLVTIKCQHLAFLDSPSHTYTFSPALSRW